MGRYSGDSPSASGAEKHILRALTTLASLATMPKLDDGGSLRASAFGGRALNGRSV